MLEGHVWGPLYGMLIVAAVQIALNKAGLSSTTAATWGHMIYGVIIIVAVATGAVLRVPDNPLSRYVRRVRGVTKSSEDR